MAGGVDLSLAHRHEALSHKGGTTPTAEESKIFHRLVPSIPLFSVFLSSTMYFGKHHSVLSVYLCQLHHIMLFPLSCF